MATDIIMPALGMAQKTGTLVRWLRRPGDEVAKGEPVMEVETDKAVVEVESPASGVLGRPLIEEGQTVPVGDVVGHVLAPDEPEPERVSGSLSAAPAAHIQVVSSPSSQAMEERPAGRVAASPKARRVAAARGLDLRTADGSGPGGAILAADLPNAPAIDTASLLWRRMAERTTSAWTTTPHFFLERSVDASRLVAWKKAASRAGLAASYTDLIVFLAAALLRAHPEMNTTWLDGRSQSHEEVNIALAIAVEHGLVAPVIHRADRLDLAMVAEQRQTLAEKARSGRLEPRDLEGGTFTISNLGMYGVDAFKAILNGHQAGILAVGRIADDVLAVSGRVEIRPRLTLSLSCDHRLVDGARGARFLEALAETMAEPLGLLR